MEPPRSARSCSPWRCRHERTPASVRTPCASTSPACWSPRSAPRSASGCCRSPASWRPRSREDDVTGGSSTVAVLLQIVAIVFIVIAVYVSAIITANTFATIVAGRARSIALLRLLGSSAVGAAPRGRDARACSSASSARSSAPSSAPAVAIARRPDRDRASDIVPDDRLRLLGSGADPARRRRDPDHLDGVVGRLAPRARASRRCRRSAGRRSSAARRSSGARAATRWRWSRVIVGRLPAALGIAGRAVEPGRRADRPGRRHRCRSPASCSPPTGSCRRRCGSSGALLGSIRARPARRRERAAAPAAQLARDHRPRHRRDAAHDVRGRDGDLAADHPGSAGARSPRSMQGIDQMLTAMVDDLLDPDRVQRRDRGRRAGEQPVAQRAAAHPRARAAARARVLGAAAAAA